MLVHGGAKEERTVSGIGEAGNGGKASVRSADTRQYTTRAVAGLAVLVRFPPSPKRAKPCSTPAHPTTWPPVGTATYSICPLPATTSIKLPSPSGVDFRSASSALPAYITYLPRSSARHCHSQPDWSQAQLRLLAPPGHR